MGVWETVKVNWRRVGWCVAVGLKLGDVHSCNMFAWNTGLATGSWAAGVLAVPWAWAEGRAGGRTDGRTDGPTVRDSDLRAGAAVRGGGVSHLPAARSPDPARPPRLLPPSLPPSAAPLPGHISTPNSGREGRGEGGGAETVFYILEPGDEVGKEKCSLIFDSGTVFWLHDWGSLERSPPPTLPPPQNSR